MFTYGLSNNYPNADVLRGESTKAAGPKFLREDVMYYITLSELASCGSYDDAD